MRTLTEIIDRKGSKSWVIKYGIPKASDEELTEALLKIDNEAPDNDSNEIRKIIIDEQNNRQQESFTTEVNPIEDKAVAELNRAWQFKTEEGIDAPIGSSEKIEADKYRMMISGFDDEDHRNVIKGLITYKEIMEANPEHFGLESADDPLIASIAADVESSMMVDIAVNEGGGKLNENRILVPLEQETKDGKKIEDANKKGGVYGPDQIVPGKTQWPQVGTSRTPARTLASDSVNEDEIRKLYIEGGYEVSDVKLKEFMETQNDPYWQGKTKEEFLQRVDETILKGVNEKRDIVESIMPTSSERTEDIKPVVAESVKTQVRPDLLAGSLLAVQGKKAIQEGRTYATRDESGEMKKIEGKDFGVAEGIKFLGKGSSDDAYDYNLKAQKEGREDWRSAYRTDILGKANAKVEEKKEKVVVAGAISDEEKAQRAERKKAADARSADTVTSLI